MERRWEAEALFELLSRVGSDACRPDDFGFCRQSCTVPDRLEIRLHRLTALEQDKLMEDYQGVLDEIADLLDILGSHEDWFRCAG